MAVNLEEPTTPEYEKAKKGNVEDTIEDPTGGEEEPSDLEDIANM